MRNLPVRSVRGYSQLQLTGGDGYSAWATRAVAAEVWGHSEAESFRGAGEFARQAGEGVQLEIES